MSYQQPPNYPQSYPQPPNTQYQPWQGQPGFQHQASQPVPPPNFQSYPPMMPPQMPQLPPKKKSKVGLIVGIVIAVLVLGCIGSYAAISSAANHAATTLNTAATTITNSTTATSVLTTKPQTGNKWMTTHTFTGSGIKKTVVFSVPNDWKITWTCKPSSFFGGQYNVQVFVYNSDGSMQDVAINEICKTGNTSGETEEHHSGSVYLDMNSEGFWNVQVQEVM